MHLHPWTRSLTQLLSSEARACAPLAALGWLCWLISDSVAPGYGPDHHRCCRVDVRSPVSGGSWLCREVARKAQTSSQGPAESSLPVPVVQRPWTNPAYRGELCSLLVERAGATTHGSWSAPLETRLYNQVLWRACVARGQGLFKL